MTTNEHLLFGHTIKADIDKNSDDEWLITIIDPETSKSWNRVFVYHRGSGTLEDNSEAVADLVTVYQDKGHKVLNGLLSITGFFSTVYDILETLVSVLFGSLVGLGILIILLVLMAWILASYLVVVGVLVIVLLFYVIKFFMGNEKSEIDRLYRFILQLAKEADT